MVSPQIMTAVALGCFYLAVQRRMLRQCWAFRLTENFSFAESTDFLFEVWNVFLRLKLRVYYVVLDRDLNNLNDLNHLLIKISCYVIA